MEKVVETILQGGVLGACCLLFVYAIISLWKDNKAERTAFLDELRRMNDARVSEVQANKDQLIAVTQGLNETMGHVASAMESLRFADDRTTDALREFSQELRDLRADIRHNPHPTEIRQ